MLDLHTGSAPDCASPSRRTFLRLGGLSAFGLGLPTFLKARADSPTTAKAKRCILL